MKEIIKEYRENGNYPEKHGSQNDLKCKKLVQ